LNVLKNIVYFLDVDRVLHPDYSSTMNGNSMNNMLNCQLKENDFEKISRLVYQISGINLHEGKKELVSARLGKRLREGGFKSFADYYHYVASEDGIDEIVKMIDAISTNLTYFFREESHFTKFSKLLPVFAEKVVRERRNPELLIWSAGCSTGEEVYSLAITSRESMTSQLARCKFLATDISTGVIQQAATGLYPMDKAKSIPPLLLNKYFQRGSGKWANYVRVKKEIREMIRFKIFNLMRTPPSHIAFDFIFCRNVMIYFDKQTQQRLVNNFYNSLKPGGYFFTGHSESLMGIAHPFKYVEPSVYTKA
jgi:chemotaxis protein methyltransferase CheR